MASVMFFKIRPNKGRKITPEAAKLGADEIKIYGERLGPALQRERLFLCRRADQMTEHIKSATVPAFPSVGIVTRSRLTNRSGYVVDHQT